jgi:chromosome partitioning protein
MNVTVTNFQGGSTKTTTAFHIARYLQTLGHTLLIDADANRSPKAWAARGGLPDNTYCEDAQHGSDYEFT